MRHHGTFAGDDPQRTRAALPMTRQRVPMLVYHHVYADDAPELTGAVGNAGAGCIGRSQFLQQVRYIAEHGWEVVSTTRIVDWLAGDHAACEQGVFPGKAVALHFDNGWLDTYSVTLPILQDAGFAATCFPITDGVEAAAVGQAATVRTLTEGVVEKPFMTWDHLARLCDAGWEIGAHTATHCKLAESHAAGGDEAVLAEVHTSNDLFQQRLGLTPDHFAYPSGSRSARTDALLARHYRSLRLWHFESPIRWTFTDSGTSPLALDCQNVDVRVSFDEFRNIFDEALAA